MLRLLSPQQNGFEELYLKVRQKEGRLYQLQEVEALPSVSKSDPYYDEWQLRKKGLIRFIKHLKKRNDVGQILELGCGNAWFSAAIAKKFPEKKITACDLNLPELRMAEKAFPYPNLELIYADIFEDWPQYFSSFDLVILPSAVQYFPDLSQLIHRLWHFTSEVQIMASPFYAPSAIEAARQRSENYYSDLDFPQMASSYYHHSYDELNKFSHRFLYRPSKWHFRNEPFPWVAIYKK